MQQRLAAMPGRFHMRTLDDLAHLVAQQWNAARAFAVCGRGEQSDEAPLPDRLAGLVEFLDAYVVEVGMPVNSGAGVCLGEDEPVPGTREPLHFEGQLDGLVLPPLVVGQQAEPAAFHGPQENLVLAIGELVLAIAEKRKVVADHPVQQQLAFLAQFLVDARRPELEQLAGLLHFLAHFRPVADGHAHVGEDLEDFLLQQLELLRIRFLVDRESNERLEPAHRLVAFRDPLDLAAAVSNDANDRVNGDMNGQPLPVDRRKYRVDQERHVVVDHLDEGKRRFVAMIVQRWIENPHEGLPAFSPRAVFEMVQRDARHGLLDPSLQVFIGDVGKILAKEELDLLSVFEGVGLHPGSYDGVDDSFPDVASPAIFGSCHS